MIEWLIFTFLMTVVFALALLTAFWLGYKAGRKDETLITQKPDLELFGMEEEESLMKTPEDWEEEHKKELNEILGRGDDED